mgnify:CR=1 FL=1|jgi:NTP pyrophosphatase (non-canonical NTP hydrolase)
MISNIYLNSPINSFQQLLAITAEECGELTQVCMKIMRKYDSLEDAKDDKYINLLIEEVGDVMCMLELMIEHKLITNRELSDRITVKRNKLKQWSTLIDDEN